MLVHYPSFREFILCWTMVTMGQTPEAIPLCIAIECHLSSTIRTIEQLDRKFKMIVQRKGRGCMKEDWQLKICTTHWQRLFILKGYNVFTEKGWT